jgi:hypothetical protein
MLKSLLLTLTITLGLASSLATPATALKSAGRFGGIGPGTCSDVFTTDPCWCTCVSGGDEIDNCEQSFFYDGHFVCAFCYGDTCSKSITSLSRWSFIP